MDWALDELLEHLDSGTIEAPPPPTAPTPAHAPASASVAVEGLLSVPSVEEQDNDYIDELDKLLSQSCTNSPIEANTCSDGNGSSGSLPLLVPPPPAALEPGSPAGLVVVLPPPDEYKDQPVIQTQEPVISSGLSIVKLESAAKSATTNGLTIVKVENNNGGSGGAGAGAGAAGQSPEKEEPKKPALTIEPVMGTPRSCPSATPPFTSTVTMLPLGTTSSSMSSQACEPPTAISFTLTPLLPSAAPVTVAGPPRDTDVDSGVDSLDSLSPSAADLSPAGSPPASSTSSQPSGTILKPPAAQALGPLILSPSLPQQPLAMASLVLKSGPVLPQQGPSASSSSAPVPPTPPSGAGGRSLGTMSLPPPSPQPLSLAAAAASLPSPMARPPSVGSFSSLPSPATPCNTLRPPSAGPAGLADPAKAALPAGVASVASPPQTKSSSSMKAPPVTSVLSSMLATEPEPTKSSVLLTSLLSRSSNSTSDPSCAAANGNAGPGSSSSPSVSSPKSLPSLLASALYEASKSTVSAAAAAPKPSVATSATLVSQVNLDEVMATRPSSSRSSGGGPNSANSSGNHKKRATPTVSSNDTPSMVAINPKELTLNPIKSRKRRLSESFEVPASSKRSKPLLLAGDPQRKAGLDQQQPVDPFEEFLDRMPIRSTLEQPSETTPALSPPAAPGQSQPELTLLLSPVQPAQPADLDDRPHQATTNGGEASPEARIKQEDEDVLSSPPPTTTSVWDSDLSLKMQQLDRVLGTSSSSSVLTLQSAADQLDLLEQQNASLQVKPFKCATCKASFPTREEKDDHPPCTNNKRQVPVVAVAAAAAVAPTLAPGVRLIQQHNIPLEAEPRPLPKTEQAGPAHPAPAPSVLQGPIVGSILVEDLQPAGPSAVPAPRPEKPYQCPICELRFNSIGARNSHKRKVHQRSHLCVRCDIAFGSAHKLERHLKTHTGVKDFKCETCGKAFMIEQNLLQHYKLHSGQKEHVCTTCERGYFTKSGLQHHLREYHTHGAFPCAECADVFSTKYDLSLHCKVHKGANPEKCNVCSARFPHAAALKQHRVACHSNRPHACPKCSYRSKTKDKLDRHLACHGSKDTQRCPHCQTTFAFKNSLKKHLKGRCQVLKQQQQQQQQHLHAQSQQQQHPQSRLPDVGSLLKKEAISADVPGVLHVAQGGADCSASGASSTMRLLLGLQPLKSEMVSAPGASSPPAAVAVAVAGADELDQQLFEFDALQSGGSSAASSPL